jgi:hypothetical protein
MHDVKRSTEDRIKKFVQAGEDLRALISEYEGKENASEDLIADLNKLHGTYKEEVYRAALEGTISTGN